MQAESLKANWIYMYLAVQIGKIEMIKNVYSTSGICDEKQCFLFVTEIPLEIFQMNEIK